MYIFCHDYVYFYPNKTYTRSERELFLESLHFVILAILQCLCIVNGTTVTLDKGIQTIR